MISFADIEASAEDLEAKMQDREFILLRANYKLDVGTLGDLFLESIGWNEVFYPSDEEWKQLPGSCQTADGLTIPEEKSVYIKKKGMEETQRFTLAHEIGHVRLHRVIHAGESLSATAEVEASHFARALLAPRGLVKKWLDEYWLLDGFCVAEDVACAMAFDFGISTKAAAKTLKTLGFMRLDMEAIMQNKKNMLPTNWVDLQARRN